MTTDTQRAEHLRWLLDVTQVPTAAGREERVIAWIRRWASERPAVRLSEDPAGNLVLSLDAPTAPAGAGPLFITAHLDHPAFVVDRVIGPGTLQLVFRGGVMEDYFNDTHVVVHAEGAPIRARLTGKIEGARAPFKAYMAETDEPLDAVRIGDVATWDLPRAEVIDGILHTNACDDLAAVAAALASLDVIATLGPGARATRLLFTRAEEVGFLGAIAACRAKTIPEGARVIALENSRAFDDSPIGGGPIVRVGDRLSIFSPSLTGAVAKRAEDLGGPQITAQQKATEGPKWKWQRKLMAGGACEATVFCAAGYEATCVCLPLGNYHNMGDLAAVQAGTNKEPARVAREFISVSDFHGLVDLLVACAAELPSAPDHGSLIEKLWNERSFVLGR